MEIEYILYTGITSVFLFVAGVFHSMVHADYVPPKALTETFRLLRFSENNLEDADKAKFFPFFNTEIKKKEDTRYKRILEKYQEFKSGKVFNYENLKVGWIDNFFVGFIASIMMTALMLLAIPFFAVLMASNDAKEKVNGKSLRLITHPLDRYKSMMQIIGEIAYLAILLSFILFYYFFSWPIISIILAIEIIVLFVFCIKLTINQMNWKSQWSEILDLIMQKADNENNDDLHNKALLLNQSIEKYSDIPISEFQKVMVVLFAILQFSVPKIVELFELKELISL